MSIVYILTNECMPDLIKIGRTSRDLEERIKELSRHAGVPTPFECYYAVDVGGEHFENLEEGMHKELAKYRISQKREFFKTTPENAKHCLKIAEAMGGKEVTPNPDDIIEDSQDKEDLAKNRRQRFNFKMVGIEVGTTLHFKGDSEITCEVADDMQVIFREEKTSLSNSARIVLQEKGVGWASYAGPHWWCLDGKTLLDLRLEKE